jgi:hypothetical protein
LWGYKRTNDDEERCFGGYNGDPNTSELYSIDEFVAKYNENNFFNIPRNPQKINPVEFKKLKRKYDAVFIDKEDVEKYYKNCGIEKETK